MQKKIIISIITIFVGQDCSALQTFEKPLNLYKKIVLSSAIVSGTTSSLILVGKTTSKPINRILLTAGILSCAGVSLLWIWKNQTKKKDCEKKVATFLELIKNAAEVYIPIGDKESSLRNSILRELKLRYSQAVSSKEIYTILQYDQQVLKRRAYEVNREKIKALVDSWYRGCEADAIIDHMKREIEIVLNSAEERKIFICNEIKKFFEGKPGQFSAGLYTEREHKEIVKEIRRKEHWVLLHDTELREIILG